jgi:hypothetical protein
MAGNMLMPLLVIDRMMVDGAVGEDGWRDGQDFLILFNDASYATRPIFKEYVKEVVFTHFNTARETMHPDDFAGLLLRDHCSSHIDEEVVVMLARETIRLVTFPPHTFYLFQPLDLVTIAAFKREK